jgi:Tfp pilus assembly protein FimT
MNSALSVPWGAVGCRDNRGITLLQLLVTIGITGTLLAAPAPNIASVIRVYAVRSGAEQIYSELQNARMVAVTQNRPYAFTVVDAGSYSVEAGSDAAVTIPTHSGISRHLDLNAECDRIQLERDRSDCDDRDPNESWGSSVAVAVSPTGRVRVE